MLLFGYYLGKNSQWVSDHSNNEAIIRIIFYIVLYYLLSFNVSGFLSNSLVYRGLPSLQIPFKIPQSNFLKFSGIRFSSIKNYRIFASLINKE